MHECRVAAVAGAPFPVSLAFTLSVLESGAPPTFWATE